MTSENIQKLCFQDWPSSQFVCYARKLCHSDTFWPWSDAQRSLLAQFIILHTYFHDRYINGQSAHKTCTYQPTSTFNPQVKGFFVSFFYFLSCHAYWRTKVNFRKQNIMAQKQKLDKNKTRLTSGNYGNILVWLYSSDLCIH